LDIAQKALNIYDYEIISASEVPSIVKKIQEVNKLKTLIHISSYIHNTVLVQNLKKELLKILPNAKIVLLKNLKKKVTFVTVYTLENDVDLEYISDEILKELYLENSSDQLDIKHYRDQLFNRYFTDHLTNLPNMYQLRRDLEENQKQGLVILNIDNFKTINNFYGFIVGDYVIEEVGRYLKSEIKESIVYKLSGDEFAIVLSKDIGFYDLKNYLQKLYNRIKNFVVKYQDIDIFIDFTLASSSHKDGYHLFSKVSMALQYAKEMGLTFWIYEDRMNFENEYERNIKLSSLVRSAVEDSKIVPYFQAIIDNKTLEVTRYECLARLIDKNDKILSPVLFIPVAKKMKAYTTVTKLIIEQSFATFENLDFEFSVNLSIEDIMNSEIFKFIIAKLESSHASSRVTFEILESEAIQDFKKVERFISEVRRYGAKIAIDDFGSGYSNFSYLTKMKPNCIKIDGSLIENIDVDKNALIVVETIVSFAKKLGISTVAEYVHSSIVMDIVQGLEIDFSQGFYIDEPSVNVEVVK
jgi:c-di-GMP phosphodiesterase